MVIERRIAFLDMDGVLADFVGGVCAAHNRPDPYLDPASAGVWDMEKLWGMSAKEFWAATHTERFWLDLQPTADAQEIVDGVVGEFGLANVAILTAPSLDPNCVPGKREWMKRYFPELAKQMIFANAKGFLAGPGRYLFDDRDKNIDEFNAAGGVGILIPRPWNRGWGSTITAVEVVRSLGLVERAA